MTIDIGGKEKGLIVPSYEKNIILDLDLQGKEQKIYPLLFNSACSLILRIILLEFEIYGTFYIPHCHFSMGQFAKN
jgi:hypothetical protein